MAKHNQIGKLGEEIACSYLIKHKFHVKDRNYYCKLGEIDIIAEKDNVLFFVEVKSKTVKSFNLIKDEVFSPEKNITREKRRKLLKTIKNYLNFKKLTESDTNISILALIVYINEENKKAKIKRYDNIFY